MSGAIVATSLAGEPVLLHAERGLYWPREGLLAIADLHLGKGDAFRRHGIALPPGGTALDLQRLDVLIDAFAPASLLVLGDLVHGAVHESADWIERWLAWRARHAGLEVGLVRGNHDRALAPERLRVVDYGACLVRAPFLFTHEAARVATASLHSIGGHMHPVAVLRELGFSTRLPAFHLGTLRSVLPAFSTFTGGIEVRAQGGDRLVACAGDRLLMLPAPGRARRDAGTRRDDDTI